MCKILLRVELKKQSLATAALFVYSSLKYIIFFLSDLDNIVFDCSEKFLATIVHIQCVLN